MGKNVQKGRGYTQGGFINTSPTRNSDIECPADRLIGKFASENHSWSKCDEEYICADNTRSKSLGHLGIDSEVEDQGR